MIKPFHNAAVVSYKSKKQCLGSIHITAILYLVHIKVELRLNIRNNTEHREIGTIIGAPVKTCVYNVGLWRKFCIFALTKLY